ncbi:MAG: Pvc16 family protein [Caulobacter sp.]|nr:Pvc16 family protein [Caulobacter sp.]
MDPDLAIASITLAIRQRLQAALNRVGSLGGEVRTERPDKLTDTGAPIVNLYLYQLNLNPFMRNNDLDPVIVRTPDTSGGYKIPATSIQTYRVPLKLRYMLSFFGDERTLVPQRLLAVCVAALHRLPQIDARAIGAAAGLVRGSTTAGSPPPEPLPDFDDVNLSFADLTLDDTYRLWSAFKATYALSVGYLADTAIIYSAPEPTEVSLVEELELTAAAVRPLPDL